MKDAIDAALDAYEAGNLREALNCLVGLGEPPVFDLDSPEGEAIMGARARALDRPLPAAALEWVALARDRLRFELGDSAGPAIVPVPVSLNTALGCL